MPKLSEDSLSKRFQCQYCGQFCRTRQGLSGHIQFKHGVGEESSGEESSVPDAHFVLSEGFRYKRVGLTAGMPMSQIAANQRALGGWVKVKGFCEFLGVKLTPQDFKNYIILRLACMHENEM